MNPADALMLTLDQVAERCGLSIHTVRGWRRKERAGLQLSPAAHALVTGFIKVGSSIRCPAAHLNRWLRDRRGEVRPNPGPVAELANDAARLAGRLREVGRDHLARVAEGLAGALEEGSA